MKLKKYYHHILLLSSVCFLNYTINAASSNPSFEGDPGKKSITRNLIYLKTVADEPDDAPVPDGGDISAVRYESAFTNSDIDFRVLKSNLPYGRTLGSQSVNPVGGASYTIQIVTPPGTNQMEPSLAIAYNSLAGNGAMGMGWNIAGLGSVTRGNEDIYHDGAISEAEHLKTDPYFLNGSRLKLLSGTYGTNGSVYGVDNESFAKIEAVGSNYSGPAWFRVTTKDGLIYEYGSSSNSLFHHSNGTVLNWSLSKILDCNGNYIQFNYTNLGSEHVLDEVLFTGNASAGLNPYNKIKFNYVSRTDVNTTFVKGFGIKQNHLIEEIVVTGEGNQAFKTYKFNYNLTEGHSLLREITELGSDNSTLNSTMLKYGNLPNSVNHGTTSAGQGEAKDVFTGDYNGDGHTDLLLANYDYFTDDNGNTFKYHTGSRVYYNNGTTGYSFTQGPLNNFNNQAAIQQSYSDYLNFPSSDYNGDGIDDVLTTYLKKVGGYVKLQNVKAYMGNYNSNSLNSTPVTNNITSYDIVHPNGKFFYSGDFNGDGKGDYITILSNGTGYKIFMSLDGGASPNHQVNVIGSGTAYPGSSWVQADNIFVVDFNGDGKKDIMIVDGSNTRIYTFNKNGSQYDTELLYSSGFPTQWHSIFPGDFNGDGKTDLLTKTGSNWYVDYSTGTAFSNISVSPVATINLNSSSHKLKIGDFNGDGMDDIFHGVSAGSNSTHRIYFSTGRGFIHQLITSSAPLLGAGVTAGDFNGDGKVDLISQTYYASPMDIYHYKPDGTHFLLQKISDGYAFVTEFRYKSLAKGGSFYSKGSQTTYPMIKTQAPLYAVEKMTIPDGIGGVRNTYYAYEGAQLHKQGRGFLGMQKFKRSDFDRDMETIATYKFNSTYFAKVLESERVAHISNGNLVSEKSITNHFDPLSANRFWVRVSYISEKDHIRNFTTTSAMTYTSNGVMTMRETNRGLPISGYNTPTEYVKEQFSNFVSTCSGISSYPRNITITTIRNGGTAVVKQIQKAYNSHDLYRTIEFAGSAEPLTAEVTQFDAFGNVKKSVLSSPGLPSQTTEYGYDSKGRFVTSEKNALGQVSYKSYNVLWGKPSSVTSIDGLTSTNTFDAYGRIKTSTDHYNKVQQHNWVWELQTGSGTNTTVVQNALYRHEIITPGFPDEKHYYDNYDRVRERRKMGFNGQWIKNVNSFDKLGRHRSSTTPFHNTSTALVSLFNYDLYDRQTVTSTGAGNIGYSYSTNGVILKKTTFHANGMTSYMMIDPTGKVVESSDDGGVLTFNHDSWGNITKTALDGNTKSTLTYDPVFGRKTSISDIDGGTTQYQYNAYGQLVSQTDANGNARTTTYDVIGRPMTESGPEGTTSYTYVTSGNGLNQLKKLTGFNGLTKEYEYDSYNRLSKLSVPYLSAFSTRYGYDGYGRLTNTMYSTDVQIMNNFDASGYLEKVYSVENDVVNQQSVLVTLFEAQKMNAFEKYTEYDAGNGVTSYVTYNDHGLPTFYNAGNGAVQYLQLEWDNMQGNLTKRTDWMKGGINETFSYDNLDRLTSSNVSNGGPSLNTTYDDNGNISWHSNIEHVQYQTTFDDGRIKKIANPYTDISHDVQSIDYTPFNETNEIDEGNFNLKFNYGPDKKRIQSILKENGQLNEVRAYVPEAGFESVTIDGYRKNLHYVHFGDKLGVIIIRCENIYDGGGGSGGTGGGEIGDLPAGGDLPEGGELEPDGPGPQPIGLPGCNNDYNYFYSYGDHLGSILTITNEYGNIIAEQSFDAWGRYRDPDTWNYISGAASVPDWLIRGFTGHEKLDEFEIIHMNGRLYAPKTGRMLSPDNNVQSPYNTQSYNRYSYVFNNPTSYIDPDGEIAWFVPVIIGAVVGGYAGATIQQGSINPADWNSDWWQGAVVGAIIGAGAGAAITAGVASSGGVAATNSIGMTTGHGVTTLAWDITANALLTANINMLSSFLQGRPLEGIAKSGLVGLAAGGIGGAVGHFDPTGVGKSFHHRKYLPMSQKAYRTTNLVTSTLNGAGDRFILSLDQGMDLDQALLNGLKGAAEGYYSAKYIGNKDMFTGLGSGYHITGRYVSAAVSTSITSVPGLGLTIATYHMAYAIENGQFGETIKEMFTPQQVVELSRQYVFQNYPAVVTPPWP